MIGRGAATARRHRVRAGALASLVPRTGGAGLVVGEEPERCARLDVFTGRGTSTVAAVGHPGVGTHLLRRALGVGACVTVRCDEVSRWEDVVAAAVVGRERLMVIPTSTPVQLRGDVGRPHLVVEDTHDLDATPAERPGPPWTCELSIVDRVTPAAVERVRRADALAVHPRSARGTELLGTTVERVLAEPGHDGWEDVALLAGDTVRWIALPPGPD